MIEPKFLTETKVVIGPCRLSFPSLFSKKKFDGDTGEGKYMTTVLIPKKEKATVEALKKAIEAAKKQGLSAKWNNKLPKNFRDPLIDGDDSDDEYIQGHYTIRAKSNSRPNVTDRSGQPITDEDEIYGGVWALVSVSMFAYNTAGNGVGVALESVRKFKDDEPFGRSSGDDFADIEFDDEDDL